MLDENSLSCMKTRNSTIILSERPSQPSFRWAGGPLDVGEGEIGWNGIKPDMLKEGIVAGRSCTIRLWELSVRLSFALLRTLGFSIIAALAVADAILTRIVAVPTAVALAHARATWIHRWSRAARWVLGVRMEQRGVMPASGIITAKYTCFLDAILLAAVRPCVFVAGAEVRRRPVIGLLARLGGTLFVDRRRHNDVARVNFLIERALRRRLLVVIFPECGGHGDGRLGPFATALFQPAVELGCSVTGAAFIYQSFRNGESVRKGHSQGGGLFRQFAHVVSRWRHRAVGAFCGPSFHHGNRKQLASQLRMETLDLLLRIEKNDGAPRGRTCLTPV